MQIIIENGDGTVRAATIAVKKRDGETDDAFTQRHAAAIAKVARGKPWRVQTDADAQAIQASKPIQAAKDRALFRDKWKRAVDDESGMLIRVAAAAALLVVKGIAAEASNPAQFREKIAELDASAIMAKVKPALKAAIDGD